MAIDLSLANLINLLAFVGLTVATYTVFYFGRSTASRGISINLFTLSLGINLIGLSHLFRILLDASTQPLVSITVGAGALFMSTGIIWVFYEKRNEVERLKKRGEEINSIISKLKDKYLEQGLSEEDLKASYSSLLRELAEIEVKLAKELE